MAEVRSPYENPSLFDGITYDPTLDEVRLSGQLERVRALLLGGAWYSLAHIAAVAGCSEAGASARVRDLRKTKWGGYTIERKRVDRGLHHYRLLRREP